MGKSIRDRRRHPLAKLVLVGTISLGGAVTLATATGASSSSSFHITKVVPAVSHVTRNGPRDPITIDWAGAATFPITAHYAPAPGCAGVNDYCASETDTFTSGTHALVWKRAAWCTGNGGSSYGTWYVWLTDAHGHRTPKVKWSLSCTS
ncbi:MAG: hypothetical protein ACLP81_09310 [Acidimicrobiales bacterium]